MRALAALVMAAFAWAAPAAPAHALVCLLACSCTVSASDIDFGVFEPLSGATQDSVGLVSVSCTGLLNLGAGVRVELGQGQWGNYSARKLRSAAGDLIDYNIYTNPQRTIVWGDGGGGSQFVQLSGGLIVLGGWSTSRDMFARLQAAPAMKPGAYADTVIVRVIW